MRAARRKDDLVLEFGSVEKQILLHTIAAILENYKRKPADIDPRTAAVWYSTRGCKSAGMSEEETREWVVRGCTTAGIGCLECKQPVIDSINHELKPIRERAAQLSLTACHADLPEG